MTLAIEPSLRVEAGSVHTDLFGLTGASKMSNSCVDSHSGIHASLSGKDILLYKALVKASAISVFI